MLFAATNPAETFSPEVQEYQKIMVFVLLALLPVAVGIFGRLLWKIETEGTRTRPDLFALPEIMAVCVVFGFIFFPVAISKAMAFFVPVPAPSAPPEPITVSRMLNNMLMLSLPVVGILSIVVMRGGRLRDLYTPGRARFFASLGWGLGLAMLAFSLTTLTKVLVIQFMGPDRQKLVQGFETAISGGNQGVIAAIAFSAVVVAPICEEILFRGSLYPVLSRVLGRGPSAVISALVFALVHDTYSDAPSLAVLALCFTIGYEVTGSLLVPIFMHAAFNGISLVQQWLLLSAAGGG